MIRPLLVVLFAATPALAATIDGVEVPAPPPPQDVVDTHWGERVEDPYRCLENTSDPAVQKLMHAQADATEAILAKIPGRGGCSSASRRSTRRCRRRWATCAATNRGGIFYLKREAADNQFKLVLPRGFDGADKVLVDPEVEAKATGKPHAIGGYSAIARRQVRGLHASPPAAARSARCT